MANTPSDKITTAPARYVVAPEAAELLREIQQDLPNFPQMFRAIWGAEAAHGLARAQGAPAPSLPRPSPREP